MFHTRNSSQNTAEFVLLDQLVEEDHLLRKIDKHIDFSFIIEKVKPYYSENKGRPSLDLLVSLAVHAVRLKKAAMVMRVQTLFRFIRMATFLHRSNLHYFYMIICI